MSLNESRLRKKAINQGLRLRKARKLMWGLNGLALYHLLDSETGLPVWHSFEDLSDVETWLDEWASA